MQQNTDTYLKLYTDELQGNTETATEAQITSIQAQGRNYIPVMVIQTGEQQYRVVANGYILDALNKVGINRVWVIVISSEVEEAVLIESGEQPKSEPQPVITEELEQYTQELIDHHYNLNYRALQARVKYLRTIGFDTPKLNSKKTDLVTFLVQSELLVSGKIKN